jgi:hypothetical protein
MYRTAEKRPMQIKHTLSYGEVRKIVAAYLADNEMLPGVVVTDKFRSTWEAPPAVATGGSLPLDQKFAADTLTLEWDVEISP